jgi:hypothetical protein
VPPELAMIEKRRDLQNDGENVTGYWPVLRRL